MRQLKWAFILFCFVSLSVAADAAEARILKVLPHYLDSKGRHTLSPSLYERDAYQAQLRAHPNQRSALRFDVQWKGKDVDFSKLKLRVYLRGVKGNAIQSQTIESALTKSGWLSNWSALQIKGKDYKEFGELVAWRATLWEGDRQLSEQKSFLW